MVLQLIGAAVGCIVGGLSTSGELKPIQLKDDPRPIVTRPFRPEFASFSGRGPVFPKQHTLKQ